MLEFMGITPGPSKREMERAVDANVKATMEHVHGPDYESLYNEAMQQVRQLTDQLVDAGFIIWAMDLRRDAEADLHKAKHDAAAATEKIDHAEEQLDRYRDTIEALRKRTEIPF